MNGSSHDVGLDVCACLETLVQAGCVGGCKVKYGGCSAEEFHILTLQNIF